MKKLCYLFALITSLTFLATTTTSAQNDIINMTDCDYRVTIYYGDVADCLRKGSVTVNAPANSTVAVPVPSGFGILIAKGGFSNTSSLTGCPFVIGETCTGNPTSEFVKCEEQCGEYTATLANGSVTIF